MTDPTKQPFGTVFGSRMTLATFADGKWSDSETVDTAPLPMHPATHALHYASCCFEGLKAYRWANGEVNIFRLDRHVERMQQSAELVCLPPPDADQLTDMIQTAVRENREQIPLAPGALYLRPTIIGTDINIGKASTRSNSAQLFVLTSPVGDYFTGGLRPLSVLIEDQMRSTPDFGMAKAGGNYASALRVIEKAKQEHSVDQVLFCPDGDVQEAGAANFLLINETGVLTKSLDGSFLHGVTRDSVLTLARDLGYQVTERPFAVSQMLEWAKTGEAALSGTAAVLAGIGTLKHQGQTHKVGNGEFGEHTKRLRDALVAIQCGAGEDLHKWLTPVV